MSKPVLGYWKIRGLCSNLRYQLAYQGVDYEMVEYEQGDDFSKEVWLSAKEQMKKDGFDYPNLPYFFDGDFKMSETQPIHRYIADKWMPEVLGKDAQTRATVNMMGNILGDIKMAITLPCYMDGNIETVRGAIDEKLPKVVEFLGAKKFLTGSDVTWVDFYFVEMIELMSRQYEGFFGKFPTL